MGNIAPDLFSIFLLLAVKTNVKSPTEPRLKLYYHTRSLGALQAQTSRWRHFGPLDFVLRALRALRPCDPREVDQHLPVHLYVYDPWIYDTWIYDETMIYDACIMMLVSMMLVSNYKGCINDSWSLTPMHICMYPQSKYIWSLILMHVCMMHIFLILDLDVCGYNECVYDAYIYDLWPTFFGCIYDAYAYDPDAYACMMHLFMMHISLILVPDPDTCVYLGCIYLWCGKFCDGQLNKPILGVGRNSILEVGSMRVLVLHFTSGQLSLLEVTSQSTTSSIFKTYIFSQSWLKITILQFISQVHDIDGQ